MPAPAPSESRSPSTHPLCAVSSGEVTFALGRTGAMIVHVRPGECSSPEFRLRLLFETGACVFSSPRDLGHFCTGLLAAAFGISPDEPITAPGPGSGWPADEPRRQRGRQADLLADLGAGAVAAGRRHDRRPDDRGRTHRDRRPGAAPVAARRALTTAALTTELARVVHGQEPALERVASATVAQLTKKHPSRPGSVMLIGPTGVGKTSTIEALPGALHDARRRRRRTSSGSTVASSPTPSRSPACSGHPPATAGTPKRLPLLAAVSKPGLHPARRRGRQGARRHPRPPPRAPRCGTADDAGRAARSTRAMWSSP